jgi:hypothetical protein
MFLYFSLLVFCPRCLCCDVCFLDVFRLVRCSDWCVCVCVAYEYIMALGLFYNFKIILNIIQLGFSKRNF